MTAKFEPGPAEARVADVVARIAARDLEKGGNWWRTTGEIAEKAGLSTAETRKVLEHLYQAGLISAVQERRGGPIEWRWPKRKPLLKFIDFDARREPKTSHFCVACQRDLKPGAPFRTVILREDGSPFAVHPKGARPPGAKAWPIGDDCAYRLGIFWTIDPEETK